MEYEFCNREEEKKKPKLSSSQKEEITKHLEMKRTHDMIQSVGDPESTRTVVFYFSNIIFFLLSMMVYYGLIIILVTTFAIQLYDYRYNYEDFIQEYRSVDPSFESMEFKN